MSNSDLFAGLITRIDEATQTLEADVLVLGAASAGVSAGVAIVEQGVIDVTAKALQVEQDKLAIDAKALQVSTDALQVATDTASAEGYMLASQSAKTAAELAVANALLLAPFQEAPQDGKVYGRGDGQWVEAGSGGGGSGTVTSVNGELPDIAGNVIIDAATVGALPSTYSPSWDDVTGKPLFTVLSTSADAPTNGNRYVRKDAAWEQLPALVSDYEDLTGKPTLGTMASKNDALSNGKQYARKDGAWSEVVTPPSGAAAFPIESVILEYLGSPVSEWPQLNPNKPTPLVNFSATISGASVTGESFFSTKGQPSRVNNLPEASFSFGTSDLGGDVFTGNSGVITKYDNNTVVATVVVGTNKLPKQYTWSATKPTWKEVGVDPTAIPLGFKLQGAVKYLGVQIANWPSPNPNVILPLTDFEGVAAGVLMFRATSQPSTVDYLPTASFSFKALDFPVGNPLRDFKGVITKHSNNKVTAMAVNSSNVAKWYSWSAASPAWVEFDAPAASSVPWAGITDKPLFKSMSLVDDAPSDATAYVRKGGAWVAESSGGGGGSVGYELETPVKIRPNGSSPFVSTTNWPYTNPNRAVELNDIQSEDGTITGAGFFASNTTLLKLPAGSYVVRNGTFASGHALDKQFGIINWNGNGGAGATFTGKKVADATSKTLYFNGTTFV